MAQTIPRGWQELELKDFLRFTPREVEKPKVKYRSLGIRSHCKGTFIREVENPDKVMMETLYAVKKDDLIVNITFAWEGAIALVNKSDEGALVSHRFPTYVFDRKVVVSEFFRYLIPSKRLVSDLGIISPGGAGRNRVLDRKDFLHLRFVMPPIEEQKMIAEILSTWDRAIDTLTNLIDAKTKLKKDLMHKLLTGKIRLPGFSKEWDTKTIGEFTDCTSGGTPNTSIETYWGGPILWMSSGELNKKLVEEVDGRITEAGLRNSSTKMIPKRCVLIGLAGQGKTRGTVAINMIELCTNQSIAAIFPNSTFVPEYLYYNLESRYDELRRLSTGDGGRGGLNLSIIRSLSVPFPEVAEQSAIAKIFIFGDKVISHLQKKKDLLTAQKKGLMQKLLTGKIRVNI